MERPRARLVQRRVGEPAPLQLSEEAALEPALGLEVVVLYDVADAHQHAPEEARDGVDRPARVVSGSVPVAADERGQRRPETLDEVEHDLHLPRAMTLARMRVEMEAHRAEEARGVLYLADDGALVAQALLPPPPLG